MLDPFYELLRMLFSLVCMKYMDVLASPPTNVGKYIIRFPCNISTMHFLNLPPWQKVMYIFSIYSIQEALSCIECVSVHGSRRVTNLIFTEHDDSWAWILVHCYHSLVIVIFCKTFLKVTSTSYKCTGNTLNDPSQQSFVSVLTCFYVIHLYLYNKKYLVKFIFKNP